MNKVVIFIIIGFALLGLMPFLVYLTTKPDKTGLNILEKDKTVHSFDWEKLELADTEEERNRGLMNRKELCDKCGMLFVFEQEQMVSFWMKNTYISLDMIFFDSSGLITDITESARPLDTDLRYSSSKPVKYVLEVPSGFVYSKKIKTGDYMGLSILEKAQ